MTLGDNYFFPHPPQIYTFLYDIRGDQNTILLKIIKKTTTIKSFKLKYTCHFQKVKGSILVCKCQQGLNLSVFSFDKVEHSILCITSRWQ